MSDTPSTTEAIGQLTQALRLLEAARPAMDAADAPLLEGAIDAVLVLHDTLSARADVGADAWPAFRAQLEADGLLR